MNPNFLRTLTLGLWLSCLSSALYAETVWIDVRSSVEHKITNIEGDVRISHSDIVQEVSALIPDKNTEIRLYCLSGGRAGVAADALKNAGYSDVQNVGSIGNARELRGLN